MSERLNFDAFGKRVDFDRTIKKIDRKLVLIEMKGIAIERGDYSNETTSGWSYEAYVQWRQGSMSRITINISRSEQRKTNTTLDREL